VTAAPNPVTRTPSLRRRVTLMTLAVLAVLLLVLGLTVDTLLGAQTRRSVHDRLLATAARADALAAAHTPPDQLVAQLGGGGIRALLITADGTGYGDDAIRADTATGPTVPPPPPRGPDPGPLPPDRGAPPPPPNEPPPDATAAAVVHPLISGGRVILVADTTATTALIRRLREVMIGAGVITLAVAALLLAAVTRVALRPLDQLTTLAETITGGDRGRRLRPDRPDTELGNAAAAFDGMLDALEDSEERAQCSAEAAQRAEGATRRFLADAAHELRTPIAGIRVTAEQLHSTAAQFGEDPHATGQYRRAALLLTEARRASRLIADMLDLTRLDAGVTLDLTDTDLAALADAECERAALLSPEVTVVRTGESGLHVRADANRISQILSNLVDNARRHTPPGGDIRIDVGYTEPNRSPGGADPCAEVTVTDTGPGITDADRERVFGRLVRLDSARDADRGGAGLGLAIARALARAHHGDLVCLPHGGGARFRLTLPLPGGTDTGGQPDGVVGG